MTDYRRMDFADRSFLTDNDRKKTSLTAAAIGTAVLYVALEKLFHGSGVGIGNAGWAIASGIPMYAFFREISDII